MDMVLASISANTKVNVVKSNRWLAKDSNHLNILVHKPKNFSGECVLDAVLLVSRSYIHGLADVGAGAHIRFVKADIV